MIPRPSILFFILSGLDVLKSMDCLNIEEKSGICNWIYSQQVEPRAGTFYLLIIQSRVFPRKRIPLFNFTSCLDPFHSIFIMFCCLYFRPLCCFFFCILYFSGMKNVQAIWLSYSFLPKRHKLILYVFEEAESVKIYIM